MKFYVCILSMLFSYKGFTLMMKNGKESQVLFTTV